MVKRFGFVTLVPFTMLIITVFANISQAQPPPWHAGYYLYDYETKAPLGVYSRIYTISPAVPSNHYLVEWDAIVLSYRYLWWIQTGYVKAPSNFADLRFYSEKWDRNGHRLNFSTSGPAVGGTYTYTIVNTQQAPPNRWDILCRDMSGNVLYGVRISTDPYAPLDLQAFVETSTSSIRVDGSYFSYLSYFNGMSWPFWWRHVSYADFPYIVIEISHYEFKVRGGG